MSLRLRVLAPALLVVGVIVAGVVLAGGLGGPKPAASPTSGPGASGPAATGPDGSGVSPTEAPTAAPTPTPRPESGGTELYGYLPYWQMTSTMATYLRSTPLTTLALFSVTSRSNGRLNTSPTGYKRITGPIGERLIREAHERGTKVELVFTSFGADRNAQFFGRSTSGPASSTSPGSSAAQGAAPTAAPAPSPRASSIPGPPTPAPTAPGATPGPPAPPPWERTVDELVALAVDLGVDGINVDVETLDPQDLDAYGSFLAALRLELVKAIPAARLSVATEAGPRGSNNAAAAFAAGVDRLFLMGYDYHWSGSAPGASSPVDRVDGIYTLRWSIDRYVELGIPRDRILLGLPLYGMRWRMTAPIRFSDVIGKGVTWVPNQHRDLILDPAFRPGRDLDEVVQVFWEQDGDEWLVTYYDSPATLRPKLALALDNGLAGAGFWAMGYERGLPGFVQLMRDFRSGDLTRDEAPPRPTASPLP